MAGSAVASVEVGGTGSVVFAAGVSSATGAEVEGPGALTDEDSAAGVASAGPGFFVLEGFTNFETNR